MRNEKCWETSPVYLGATPRGRAAQCTEAGTWLICCSSQRCLPWSLLCMHDALRPPYLWQPCGCCIAAATKARGPWGVWCLCFRKTHSDLFKGSCPTDPFTGGFGALPPLGGCVFSIWCHSLISPRRLLWNEMREIVFCWKTFGGSWSLGSLFVRFRNLRCTEGWGKVGPVIFLNVLWLLLPIW